jgi:IS30 family transposase
VQFFNKKQTFIFQTKEVGDKNSPYLCPLFGFVNYYPSQTQIKQLNKDSDDYLKNISPMGRKYKQLNKEDRIKIYTLLSCNKTQKEIAQELKVHPSTICRELKRNASKRGCYHYQSAHEMASERKERLKIARKWTKTMEEVMKEKLQFGLSPEQIVGECKNKNIPMVSTESIYKWIWKDKEKGGEWYKYLRTGHKQKRKRYGKKDNRGLLKDIKRIDLRPKEVENKERFGDWEADTIVGAKRQGYLLVLTERLSKFTLITKLRSINARKTAQAMINLLAPYKEFVKTITVDNGKEFAMHKYIERKLNTSIYFTHPYAAYEKGLVENTNKLIRQYFPKSLSLKTISHQQVVEVMTLLNNRPRKTLQFNTPNEFFFANFMPNKKIALGG